ncbi:MAG: anti-sigma factor [Deltaproteobacteria bacterium]|nr:anti-sigma factor [Deltaproteobacteria bacterium]
MTCPDVRELLDAHVDGELDPVTDRDVTKHLKGCASCRVEAEGLRELSDAIRMRLERRPAPAGLAPRVRAALRAAAPSNGLSRRRWRPLLAWLPLAAALLLVAFSMAVTLSRPGPEEFAVRSAVSAHVRALVSGRLVDAPSSDQHAVKPWFAGRLGFSPPVPDLSSAGFALEGGRVEYLDDRPVAALVYRRRQHYASLFVWPKSRPFLLEHGSRNGMNVLRFDSGTMTFVAVSDLAPEEVRALERAVKKAVSAEGP